ncbi:hypothetical protein ABK040_008460 [Willaertia magna]
MSKKTRKNGEKRKRIVVENDDEDNQPMLTEEQMKQLRNIIETFFESIKTVFNNTSDVDLIIERLTHDYTYFTFKNNLKKTFPDKIAFEEMISRHTLTIMTDLIQKYAEIFLNRTLEETSKIFPEEVNPNIFFVSRRVRLVYPLYDFGGVYQTEFLSGEELTSFNNEEEEEENNKKQTNLERIIQKQLFDRSYFLVHGYDNNLRGYVMGVDNVKVLEKENLISFETNPVEVRVKIEAVFYLFAPTFGTKLRGSIVNISLDKKYLDCRVLDTFNATVRIEDNEILERLSLNQFIQFEVVWAGRTISNRQLIIEGVMKEDDGIIAEDEAYEDDAEQFRFDEEELPFN